MSDKPISVGDLVEVIRPRLCCSDRSRLGGVFTVVHIKHSSALECFYCHRLSEALVAELDLYPNAFIEIARLKRIPDFPELKDEKLDEEIPA